MNWPVVSWTQEFRVNGQYGWQQTWKTCFAFLSFRFTIVLMLAWSSQNVEMGLALAWERYIVGKCNYCSKRSQDYTYQLLWLMIAIKQQFILIKYNKYLNPLLSTQSKRKIKLFVSLVVSRQLTFFLKHQMLSSFEDSHVSSVRQLTLTSMHVTQHCQQVHWTDQHIR